MPDRMFLAKRVLDADEKPVSLLGFPVYIAPEIPRNELQCRDENGKLLYRLELRPEAPR